MNINQGNEITPQTHPKAQELPSKYFDLMQIVGTQGNYQRISMIIYCTIRYLTGNILLGTPFLFYAPQYKCTGDLSNFSINQCRAYVCQLQPKQRDLFMNKKYYISSLADQGSNDYNCETSIQFQFAKSAIYVGCLIGYVFVSPLIDNLGRKSSIVICQILSIFGIIVVLVSNSLVISIIGMLVAGIGLDSAIQTTFYVIAETVAQQYRQKWSVIIQAFFCIGGLGTILYYYILRDWRDVFIIYTITAIVGGIALILYTQQTPCFLIKKFDNQTVAKKLNRIGKINRGVDNLIKAEIIEYVRHCNNHDNPDKKVVSPMKLISSASIGKITVFLCIVLSIIYFLYYGPLMMIENFGLNVFVNATVLQMSQFVTFIPMYFIIENFLEKNWNSSLFCDSILLIDTNFFEHQTCENICTQNVLQLVIFFIFRFSASFEFSLFFDLWL